MVVQRGILTIAQYAYSAPAWDRNTRRISNNMNKSVRKATSRAFNIPIEVK